MYTISAFLFVCIFCVYGKPSQAPGPLILTPYLEQGKVAEAQRLSEIKGLPGSHVKSYSGFLTVNKTHDSNMFFWFVPAEKNTSAPLLIWLDGGPGVSSMFGLFSQNGPYSVNKNLQLIPRPTSWSQKYSMLYIDNPVETGFSFTKSDAGYANTEDDVARDLYSCITQFLQIFHQFSGNELYVGGQSYAGKYVPAIGYKIHVENPHASVHINLQGIFIGGAFSHPESVLPQYGEYLYNVGMLSMKEKTVFDNAISKVLTLMKQGRYIQALQAYSTVFGVYFPSYTGYTAPYNIMQIQEPPDYYGPFLNQSNVRQAIHVGNVPFQDNSDTVADHLAGDFLQSVKSWLETLMDSYKVMLYNGQLDIIVCATTTEATLKALQWKGHDPFMEADKIIWRLHPGDVDIAGYVQQYDKFQHIIMRGSGHIVPADQPERAFDMIQRFIEDIPFDQ